jgi:hypothetical protein
MKNPIIIEVIETADRYEDEVIRRVRRSDGRVVFTGTRKEFDDHCFMRSMGFHRSLST